MAGLLAQHLAVGETAEELARLDQRSCPVCGITFLEFRKQGRLGCPHDYVCFAEELEPLLAEHPRRDAARRQGAEVLRQRRRAADAAHPPAPRNEGSDRRRKNTSGRRSCATKFARSNKRGSKTKNDVID